MARTINGKPISQILNELAADLPENSICYRTFDKMPYIPIEVFTERLNSVVGIDHYNEKYKELTITHANESYCVNVIGSITLLDDNYEPLFTKEIGGGSNINFSNIDELDENGNVLLDKYDKPKKIKSSSTNSVPNDTTSACQDAYKKICKKLGIGVNQLDALEKDDIYEITFTNELKDSKGNAYFSEISCNDKKYRFALFKNKFDDFSKLGNLNTLAKDIKNKTIKIYGKLGTDPRGNAQIVFSDLYNTIITPKNEADTSYADIKEQSLYITTLSTIIPKLFGTSSAYTCNGMNDAQTKHQIIFTNDAVSKLQDADLWDTICNGSAAGIRFKAIVKQKGSILYIQETILE